MELTVYHELGMLLGKLTRLYRTLLDQSIEELGLHRGQAMLLLTLARRDGRTHSEIAEHLEISPAAATKVIKRMEQDGYVERRPDPDDERVSRVYLLRKSSAAITEIHRSFGELDRVMFTAMTQADLARLGELLTQMQANLQRSREIVPEAPGPASNRADSPIKV